MNEENVYMGKIKIGLIVLAILAILFVFSACDGQTAPEKTPTETIVQSEQSADDKETIPGETLADTSAESEQSTDGKETIEDKTIDTMEKMVGIDGVISVTSQTFTRDISGAVAYKVLYESENGKLAADVVLPADYFKVNKLYAVLIYFPEVGIDIDSLAYYFAQKGVIVIRHYARGYDQSEGVRDLGGEKDLVDVQKLLEIFDSADFIKNRKVFVAGSSEGSINALRLFAEDTKKRISGCAVVDVIADLPAFGEFRGERIQQLNATLIGKSYEEAPEEYDLRSAVKFSEKLDRPILLLHFLQNPIFSVEQTDAFYDLIIQTNPDCTYHKIEAQGADFVCTESLRLLVYWMAGELIK